MDANTLIFFEQQPDALPLYEAFCGAVLDLYPETKIKVQKTQITFLDPRGYLFISLPRSRGGVLMVSFGLSEPLVSPRLFAVANPAPGRYTHHVQIAGPQELDGELWEWIARSHADMAAREARRRG